MFDVHAFMKEEWPASVPMRTSAKERQPGDVEMSVMFYGGDLKLLWNPDNSEESGAAEDAFKRLKKKGFLTFRVNAKDASKGEMVSEFSRDAAGFIMSPAVAGG